MKKLITPALLLLALIVLQSAKYSVPYFAEPAGAITRAVVIYESEITDAMAYPKQHEVLVGQTSQALRQIDKWRQYDKDHVPVKYAILLQEAEKDQPTKDAWEPWLGIYHDDSLTWNGPVPDSNIGLEQTITSQGGY